ncbi:MAG: DUF1631 family protein [Burkholderiaceae bacterium]
MREGSPSTDLARKARLTFAGQLAQASPRLLEAVLDAARVLLDKPAERSVAQQRRDNLQSLMAHGDEWVRRVNEMLHDASEMADSPTTAAGALAASMRGVNTQQLQLVDDETVQREIYVSRLSQAIADSAVWELNDLGMRIAALESHDGLLEHDLFRPQQIAKIYVRSFDAVGLPIEAWTSAEAAMKFELPLLATEAYHDANGFLVGRGVMPEVNLRQLIRRSVEARSTQAMVVASQQMPLNNDWRHSGGGTAFGGASGTGQGGEAAGGAGTGGNGRGGPNTARGGPPDFSRTTTYVPDDTVHGNAQAARSNEADATLLRFGRTMERHVNGFMNTQRNDAPSGTLQGALASAQRVFVERAEVHRNEGSHFPAAEMVDALKAQKQALKQVANTPAERATIEVVALLFQSILTEDRIPASVRVWFARLQMPTLRVAISEPDFFSSAQHPARRLIDRMGACVMGFDAAPQGALPEIEAEVARVVQVVEAFPETGRKVFQTVLVEFERFLERYFRDQNETTKKGVSLASQVEQRETLAIQYTIELRKLLDGVPVQDGVRDFLFQVWADVLATATMRHGAQSPETREVRDAALELVWIASAKTTREERAEVIRRLGPLLASLRRGMVAGGLQAERQETALRTLNLSLTAAFAARSATIDPEQLTRLKHRLEALDEILPDADFEIDDSFALDLSLHDSDDLEVVAAGGGTPSSASLKATDEMLVGGWYMLEYRDRREPVQLVWQGMHRQLSLFVSARGRCVLFQRRRLAGFLQMHLLTPAQDETLTIAATRIAIDKINADPSRLR